MKVYVADIEANGLLYDGDTIHLICFKELGGSKTFVCHDNPEKYQRDMSTKKAMAVLLDPDAKVIGHNFAGYDIPFMEKINLGSLGMNYLDALYNGRKLYDTMLASQLLFPERNQHSLESWFHEEKVQNEAWDKLTSNIIKRCISDVDITEKLYLKMRAAEEEQGNHIAGLPMCIETADAYIQAHQEYNGVRIDVLKATELWEELNIRYTELKEYIENAAPRRCVPAFTTKYTVKRWAEMAANIRQCIVSYNNPDDKLPMWVEKIRCKPTKKDTQGKYTAAVTKWFDPAELKDANVQGPFTRIEFKRLNLDSPGQLKDFLFSLGWKPTEYNYKFENGKRIRTSPKVTEDSYESISDPVIGPYVKEYGIVKHRKNFLLSKKKDGSLGGILSLVRDDGRVEARGITIGTPTFRYRHSGIVNTPSDGSPYGKEIRQLFTVLLGCFMFGIDLSGIEARMLAALCRTFPDGDKLADLILDGDFHSHNAETWEVARRIAKSILYALMYGASAKKLGETSGKGEAAGAKIKQAFLDANPAIKLLIDSLESDFAKGIKTITALDGRLITCKQKHKLLNRAIQGNSAILFKLWKVLCHLTISELRNGDVRIIINMHDEMQFESWLDLEGTEKVGKQMVKVLRDAAKVLGIEIRLDAEYKIGRDWFDTH